MLVDVTRKLTLRGGYRYVWGDAQTGTALIAGAGQESSELRQQTGLAGVNFRANQKLRPTWISKAPPPITLTSAPALYNYQRMRARARYQVTSTLSLQASFSLLNNQNPSPASITIS